MQLQRINDIVAGLAETYDTTNPFELCECLDIKIMKSRLGTEIKGFFQRTPCGCEIVHINSEIDEAETRYICAHELGHAILHTDISIGFFIENILQVKNRYEIQADRFAAELLIGNVENEIELSEMNIEQICKYLCIPVKLWKYKFGTSA